MLSAVLDRPVEELHVLLDAVVCVVKMYTHSQIMHFRHQSKKISFKETFAKDNVSIEHLVDEVMEEELTSPRSQYNSSPGSESSSDKDSLIYSLDHLNYEKHKTAALLVQGPVHVRMPLHVGGDIRVVLRPSDADKPCEVCSARAGKHSYYGGQVCPSCRAFFRRSVQAGYSEKFKCKRG